MITTPNKPTYNKKEKQTGTAFNGMFSFPSKLFLCSLAGVGGVVVLLIIFYEANRAFHDSSQWVTHTRNVIDEASSVSALAKDMQWTNRNYLLTGDSALLQPYEQVKKDLQNHLQILDELVAGNAQQSFYIKRLHEELAGLQKFSDEALLQRQHGGFPGAIFVEKIREHITQYDQIHQLIDQIRVEEGRQLEIREAENDRNIKYTERLFVFFGVLIFLLLLCAFLATYYHFQKRKRAEIKIMHSEAQFRLLINSIKDLAIFMTDANGYILDWYQGGVNIKGYTKEEVIGKHIAIFYTPDQVEQNMPQKNLAMAAIDGTCETEGWRVRKNGSRFWADVLITAIYDKEGKVQGFTKVTRDFSLHKKAEEESRRALEKEKELNLMKSNFVSIASHEFRTPLSTIVSSVALLEQYKTTETQDRRDKHILRIKSSVSDLVTLLEQFLSLEKIEDGKVILQKKMFNIKERIDSICAKMESVARPGQAIEYFHDGEEQIFIDTSFIDHIATNLISNAVKYSLDNKKISVVTRVTKETVELKVKDEGIGISTEDQQHLFERFFRASNTGNIKGTGLGLHIVKRYVDLIGGTISVKTEEGKGSEFTVVLPVEYADETC